MAENPARFALPDRETWLATLGGVFTRVALFGIEGTNAKVTGVHGLSDLLIGTTASLVEQTPLRWAVEAASPIVDAGRSPGGVLMTGILKLAAPRAFAVVPLVFGRKLAGLAYGDRGSEPLPLASVAEVFAACERLLNPKAQKQSALPEKTAFRSTSQRDNRERRPPRPTASRRDDGGALMLTDIVEEPPIRRDTAIDPVIPSLETPPPPPEQPPPREQQQQRQQPPQLRDAPPAQSRGFRRGRRRASRQIARPLSERDIVETSSPPASPPPARPPPLAEAKPPAPKPPAPKPVVRSRVRPDTPAQPKLELPEHDPPEAWGQNNPDARTTETQRFSFRELLSPARFRAPLPPDAAPRGDAELIKMVRRRASTAPMIVGTTLALSVLIGLAMLVPPSSNGAREHVVTVPGGASAATIGAALKEAHLVRSAVAFTVVGELTRTRGLRAGSYRVRTDSWPWQVATQLRNETANLLDVVIPEGASLTEIAKRIERAGIADADAIKAVSHSPSLLSAHGIASIDAQGWLAPGAYSMSRGIDPADAMSVMIDRFQASLATLPETATLDAEALNRVMVLASLVEKEAKDKSEARRIAGLFFNRLKLGMRLESRATALYILGTEKKELTLADVRQPSPYNTFLNAGLPPGPIATPSLESLRAALHPEEHGYFYMIDRDEGAGSHVFSATYEEHLKAQRENR